jgi:hypothetical protein
MEPLSSIRNASPPVRFAEARIEREESILSSAELSTWARHFRLSCAHNGSQESESVYNATGFGSQNGILVEFL